MSYTPPAVLTDFRSAHYFSVDTCNSGPASISTTAAAAIAWGTQYRAIYVPVRVRESLLIRKLWVYHSSTGTGNFDVGVYSRTGSRLVSTGSTAKTAANAIKVVDVTDTPISQGLYYLALNADSTTDTYMGDTDAAPLCTAMGILTETLASVTLPATASWGITQTLAIYPVMGLFSVTTVS